MSLRNRVPISASPDSDVGVARSCARQAAHLLGPSRMARLLLFFLRSIALRTIALAVVLQMSACIIPVAPDFQDPPAAQNDTPYFMGTSPEQGTVVVAIPPTFNVTVAAPTVG